MARLSFFVRREFVSLILGAVLILTLVNAIFGPMNSRDLTVLRTHRAMLEARRARLLERNQALSTSVAKLSSDNSYIEHLIRRELGFARTDEVIYRFAPHSSSASH
jgi:cell division protein FtsB